MNPSTITLIDASQALLEKFASSDTANSSSYCDLAIVVAEARMDSDKAAELADTAEAFVSELDDRQLSASPEWESLSLAVDGWRKRQ